MIGAGLVGMTLMEAPDLYLAIRVSNLSLVLALAAGQPPKFEQLAWKTAEPSAKTIKAPAPKTV